MKSLFLIVYGSIPLIKVVLSKYLLLDEPVNEAKYDCCIL